MTWSAYLSACSAPSWRTNLEIYSFSIDTTLRSWCTNSQDICLHTAWTSQMPTLQQFDWCCLRHPPSFMDIATWRNVPDSASDAVSLCCTSSYQRVQPCCQKSLWIPVLPACLCRFFHNYFSQCEWGLFATDQVLKLRWSRVKFCFKNRLACLENKQKWKKDKNELNWKMLKMGIPINSLINAFAYWMCYTPLVLESKDLSHISVVRAVRWAQKHANWSRRL